LPRLVLLEDWTVDYWAASPSAPIGVPVTVVTLVRLPFTSILNP
jgi:hypothetical protein